MWLSGCGSRVQSESTKTKIKPFKWKAFNKTYKKKKKKKKLIKKKKQNRPRKKRTKKQ